MLVRFGLIRISNFKNTQHLLSIFEVGIINLNYFNKKVTKKNLARLLLTLFSIGLFYNSARQLFQ